MKTKLHLGRGAAILACVAALAAAAFAPSAASAATKCANKTIKIPVEGGKPIPVPAKAITVEGISCAEAYKVIAGVIAGEPPKGWKTYGANFPTPEGLVPVAAKNGSKKIKFATRGG